MVDLEPLMQTNMLTTHSFLKFPLSNLHWLDNKLGGANVSKFPKPLNKLNPQRFHLHFEIIDGGTQTFPLL